jgi:transcriptional regulator with XRE-family HTH domain
LTLSVKAIYAFLAMPRKFAAAIKSLRESLGMTQLELAIKLDIGGHAVPHFECSRMPNVVTTARLCRLAHEAGLDDPAEIFVAALPGVEEGLLIPVWRLAREQQPEAIQLSRKSPRKENEAY